MDLSSFNRPRAPSSSEARFSSGVLYPPGGGDWRRSEGEKRLPKPLAGYLSPHNAPGPAGRPLRPLIFPRIQFKEAAGPAIGSAHGPTKPRLREKRLRVTDGRIRGPTGWAAGRRALPPANQDAGRGKWAERGQARVSGLRSGAGLSGGDTFFFLPPSLLSSSLPFPSPPLSPPSPLGPPEPAGASGWYCRRLLSGAARRVAGGGRRQEPRWRLRSTAVGEGAARGPARGPGEAASGVRRRWRRRRRRAANPAAGAVEAAAVTRPPPPPPRRQRRGPRCYRWRSRKWSTSRLTTSFSSRPLRVSVFEALRAGIPPLPALGGRDTRAGPPFLAGTRLGSGGRNWGGCSHLRDYGQGGPKTR